MQPTSRATGFTLIELLVVIAIIGLLSAIILAALSTAKSKAVDAERISDVKSLAQALELYYDSNNTYPQIGAANSTQAISLLSTYLVPGDISEIPPVLVSDADQYTWATGVYGLEITTTQSGWCKTGVGVNSSWWLTSTPSCAF